MFTYRTKLRDSGRPHLHLRWSNAVTCPICNEQHHDAFGFRYSEHICSKCLNSGVIQKLDDVFIYFVEHRSKPTLREQWEFSILESLAYNTYKGIVRRRTKEIRQVAKRNKKTDIDLKYTEERRIEERVW